jgi:hypothetical protein
MDSEKGPLDSSTCCAVTAQVRRRTHWRRCHGGACSKARSRRPRKGAAALGLRAPAEVQRTACGGLAEPPGPGIMIRASESVPAQLASTRLGGVQHAKSGCFRVTGTTVTAVSRLSRFPFPSLLQAVCAVLNTSPAAAARFQTSHDVRQDPGPDLILISRISLAGPARPPRRLNAP